MRTNNYFKKGISILAIGLGSILFTNKAFAQPDPSSLIKAGSADAGKLVDAYMSPLIKGFGAALNGGWYNTAKPHGLGRFDVTFHLNAVFIPDADLTFNAANLGFSKLRLANSANNIGQTIAGSDEVSAATNPEYILEETFGGNTVEVARFQSPAGLGLPYSGAPTLQASVGLIKNTEIMFRYMPTIALPQNLGDAGLIGFGLKHDIKQWIPVVNKLPFDMSAYFGYTKFDYSTPLSLAADAAPVYSGNTNTNYSDQALNMTTKATTFGLLLSKKVLLLTVYSGLNYQTSTTEIALNGNYPISVIEDQVGNTNFGNKAVNNTTDPVKFDVEGANGFTATVGARLKLLILTLNGAYTFGQYPYASVGVGLNIDLK